MGTPISTTAFVRNPSACQALCVEEENCYYFNFYANGGFCLLFDIYAMVEEEPGESMEGSGITSGPRVCSEFFLHSLESCFVLKLLVWRWMYWRLLVCIIDKWEKHESIDGTVGLHLPTGIDIECYIRALPLNKFKACVSCIIHYIMRICTTGTFCTLVLGAMTFRQFFPLHLSGCYLRPGRKFADGVVAPIDGDYLPTRTTSPMQCQARSCFVVVYSPWAKKLHKNWHFPYSTFARAMPNVISSHMKPQDMGRGFATFTLKRPWIIFSWGIW